MSSVSKPTTFGDTVAGWIDRGNPTLVAHAQHRLTISAGLDVAIGQTVPEWTFIRTTDLVRDTDRLLGRLPADIDGVIAIARSGLVPGGLISYARHLPLWTVSRQTGVSDPGRGDRLDGPRSAPRHVLLIDDTAASGREMSACSPLVAAAFPAARITRAVIYSHPRGRHAVDLYEALYPGLHYLEWNWANSGNGVGCALDFDGILCRDGDPSQPLYLPRRRPIPLIVTGRHERLRQLTIDWLAQWNLRFEQLVMRDFDAPDHFDPGRIAAFKAEHYGRSGLSLFAESDPRQAEAINRLTGRAVLCPAVGRVFPPSSRNLLPGRHAAAHVDAGSRSHCPHRRKVPECHRFDCTLHLRRVTTEFCRDVCEYSPPDLT